MTLPELIAQKPAWIGIWLKIMTAGAFVAPVGLLFWRSSRVAGILGLLTGALSVAGVTYLFEAMGYVRLLGLPHVILWTPFAIYLISRLKHGDLAIVPRTLMSLVLATIIISLAFDYADVIRYFLGDREAFMGAGPTQP